MNLYTKVKLYGILLVSAIVAMAMLTSCSTVHKTLQKQSSTIDSVASAVKDSLVVRLKDSVNSKQSQSAWETETTYVFDTTATYELSDTDVVRSGLNRIDAEVYNGVPITNNFIRLRPIRSIIVKSKGTNQTSEFTHLVTKDSAGKKEASTVDVKKKDIVINKEKTSKRISLPVIIGLVICFGLFLLFILRKRK